MINYDNNEDSNRDNNDYNDLNELKDYLINNYNLDAKIDIKDRVYNENNIKNVYFNILFLLVAFFLLLFLLKYIKNKKNYLFYIIIIFILFYLLYNLCIIYFYNKFINNYDFKYYNNKKYKKYINYKKYNDLNTGDILQEYLPWYFTILLILNFKYIHNFIVIKFNNKKYILHFIQPCKWPKYVLNIKSKNIEITSLDSYFKNNIHTRYYRVFRPKNILNNNIIFNYLKYITSKDISFSFYNIFNNDYQYQCMSFILKFLKYINIIPKFNFNTFIPDNLYNLPELSKGLYELPFIIKYN
jgi:hypothetical protein